jgi:hypothetical protein
VHPTLFPKMTLIAKGLAIIAVFCAAASAVCAAGYHPPSCGFKCRFAFCPPQGSFALGQPDTPLTGAICDKSYQSLVGSVDETREAYVQEKYGKFTPISAYATQHVSQKYSPSFFKSYPLWRPYHGKMVRFSGVGHEWPQQNQADFLHGRCFVLPLKRYQLLDKASGKVVENVFGQDPFVDCVSFFVD